MLEPTIPATLFAILETFRTAFPRRESFENFASLTLGFILCRGRHTIAGALKATALSERRDHSAFYRFFSQASWAVDDLGRILFLLLLPVLAREIFLIFDDTLAKRSGPHLFGAAMHHDACGSTYARRSGKRTVSITFGHCWVVLAVSVPVPWNSSRTLAVPVLFRLYRGKKGCPPEEYRKRTELAREMLDVIAGWLPEGRTVLILGDGEYACKTLVRDLPENVHFTGPMLMDAALYEIPGEYSGRGRPRKRGERLPSPKQMAANERDPWQEKTVLLYGKKVTILVKTITCLWYTVAGTRVVRVVLTRDPTGRLDDRTYFSTASLRTVEEILIGYARRWELEVAFFNGKQFIGIDEPQNGFWRRESGTPRPPKKAGPNPHPVRGRKAVERTLPFLCIVYSIVLVWYLRHGQPAEDVERARKLTPWYRQKADVSFADMHAALRRVCWSAGLSAHPVLRRAPKKLRKGLLRWLAAA